MYIKPIARQFTLTNSEVMVDPLDYDIAKVVAAHMHYRIDIHTTSNSTICIQNYEYTIYKLTDAM